MEPVMLIAFLALIALACVGAYLLVPAVHRMRKLAEHKRRVRDKEQWQLLLTGKSGG
jgi:hypothetical protein